jgi:hypothetical protein
LNTTTRRALLIAGLGLTAALCAAAGLCASIAGLRLFAPSLLATPLFAPPVFAPPTPTVVIMADCFWSARAFAWVDTDGDGAQDEGEPPLEGVEIQFSLNFFPGSATGPDGIASVSGMHPGECLPDLGNEVIATPPEGYAATTPARLPLTEDQVLYSFGFR